MQPQLPHTTPQIALAVSEDETGLAPSGSLLDYVETGFHHKKKLAVLFSGIVLVGIIAALFWPRQYESQAKILVARERADPPVTASESPQIGPRDAITREELNSEVELILSQDLLRQVTKSLGLAKPAKAGLNVEVLPRTNIISVTYRSPSRELSRRVVDTLVGLYLEKHAAAHSVAGQFEFFDQQVARYKKQLDDAEAALVAFTNGQDGTVTPGIQRDNLLHRGDEFRAMLDQTHSLLAETQARIHTLQAEADRTPARVATQLKSADNPQLMQDMMGTLLKLQLKRTELLTKYQPGYRLVQEVDDEIAKTQRAIAAAENSPVRDQTTDVNPVHLWIDSELAKAKADLPSLNSRAGSLARSIEDYNRKAQSMDALQLQYQDLQRNATTAEQDYLLYEKKREEARIINALDQRRILDVGVIQPATEPDLPTHTTPFYLAIVFLSAVAATAGMVFVLERADYTFRSPRALERLTRISVLATVPAEFRLDLARRDRTERHLRT